MENNLKALPMLSFGKAVSICLNKKYTTFKGRARRSEYWYFVLFQSIVLVIATILDNIVGLTFEYSFYGWLYLLCGLALLLPRIGCRFPPFARCRTFWLVDSDFTNTFCRRNSIARILVL